jgi:hypothetical protein
MHRDKHLIRKQAALVLCALFACMIVFMSTTVKAERSFLLHPSFDALKEGDVLLAPVGRRGAGLRMMFSAPGQDPAGFFTLSNHEMWQINEAASEVSLSVVIPW